ncbi:UDP-2,3-diacylglucosamine hydrolase, partial [Yersinia pestis PY-14]
MLMLY